MQAPRPLTLTSTADFVFHIQGCWPLAPHSAQNAMLPLPLLGFCCCLLVATTPANTEAPRRGQLSNLLHSFYSRSTGLHDVLVALCSESRLRCPGSIVARHDRSAKHTFIPQAHTGFHQAPEGHPAVHSPGAAGFPTGCITYSKRYERYKEFVQKQ